MNFYYLAAQVRYLRTPERIMIEGCFQQPRAALGLFFVECKDLSLRFYTSFCCLNLEPERKTA